jgi:hypothetical protein
VLAATVNLLVLFPVQFDRCFQAVVRFESQGWTFSLVACFLEIYNDVLRDLLAPPASKSKKDGGKDDEKLDIHHDNGDTVVKNLTYMPVTGNYTRREDRLGGKYDTSVWGAV